MKPNKIHYFRKPPTESIIAFSGGVDSMVLLHSYIKRGNTAALLHVDHNTDWCKQELEFAQYTSNKYGLVLIKKRIPEFDGSTSLEHFWSKHRNAVYHALRKPILTGHNLDDAVEWYIMSTMQGTAKLLNYSNQNVFRPMITTKKEHIYLYADHYKIPYLTDPTNLDDRFNLRNNVRANLIPQIELVFPGIYTTVRRLITEKEAKLDTSNRV